MLDIVIDFVDQRTDGSTKYINQRDQDFISAFLQEENYRREFTDDEKDYKTLYGVFDKEGITDSGIIEYIQSNNFWDE